MTSKDLAPHLPDGSRRKPFRHATNRKVELILQRELDDVAKKSITQITAFKEARKNAPLTEEQMTARKLAPEFVPKKIKEPMKSQPVFIDGLPDVKENKNSKPITVPPYNPLDREGSIIKLHTQDGDPVKTYPYSKDSMVTVNEMRKPHVSSVGVVPTRNSSKVDGLKVVMAGKPVPTKDLDPVIGPVERANTALPVREVPGSEGQPASDTTASSKPPFKPAIAGVTGTTTSAKYVPRPEPPIKKRTYLKSHFRMQREESDASSFKSVDLDLEDERAEDFVGEEGAAHSKPHTSKGSDVRGASVTSIKSTKDLLEEAKQIISPAHDKHASKKKEDRHSARLSTKTRTSKISVQRKSKASGIKSKGSKKDEPEAAPERTVDEIIRSLKTQSSTTVSESDKKIQEIMNKVISGNKSLLGDLVDEQALADAEKAEREAAALVLEESGAKIPEEPEKEEQEEAASRLEAPSVEEEKMKEALEKIARSKETPPPGPEPTMLDIDLKPVTDPEQEEGAVQEGEDQEAESTVDLQQAWEDLQLDPSVRHEDIISVQAQPMQLQPRQPVEEQEIDDTAPVQTQSVSFLSAWAPADRREVSRPIENPNEPVGKNMHHLCRATEDVMLPDYYRGTWRKYHVPSKHHNFLQATGKHRQSSPARSIRESIREATSVLNEPVSTLSDEESRAKAAARVLAEANKLPGDPAAPSEGTQDDFDSWQEKARQVFDMHSVEISGKKLELKSDESYLYWTPAPPKWDVTPAQVKKELFPKYHGAALAQDLEQTTVEQEECEQEEDEEEEDLTDPEQRQALNRTLRRTYSSMQELSEGRVPVGKTKFFLTMGLEIPFDEELNDPESFAARSLADNIEEQMKEILRIDPRLRNFGITEFRVKAPFVAGSVGFRLQVRSAKTLTRVEIDEVSKLLAADIETYGPLEIDGNEVTLAKQPEVMPSERRSALELFKDRSFSEELKLPVKVPRGHTPYLNERSVEIAKQMEVADQEPDLMSPHPVLPPIERTISAPGGLDDNEDMILVYQDFDATMEEIGKQKKQLKAARKSPSKPVVEMLEPDPTLPSAEPIRDESLASVPKHYFEMQKDEPTPAELALEAGRAYVLLPQKKKKKKARAVDIEAIERLERFLEQKPNELERRESMCEQRRVLEYDLRVPPKIRSRRRGSVPEVMDFEEYKKKKNFKRSRAENEREWTRDIWNTWFDQVYPPTPAESDWEEEEDEEQEEDVSMAKTEEQRKSAASSVYDAEGVEVMPILDDDEDEEETLDLLEEEVGVMTSIIETADRPRGFDYCRRGAIRRKLGHIGEAMEDLNTAIDMEPLMLDAFWHRHLIYILLNKRQQALEDLNFIIKMNKLHAQAYKSRARIYRQHGDITMAIVNFTQTIKLSPNDYESYFQRAQMYEKRGEMLLAMEDYAMATKINPQKTEALFRHGLHYFNNRNWKSAIVDFTDLLKRDPLDSKTRLLRGRAYEALRDWNHALEDFSGTIHLDPKNSKAFYYRGCLLRKLHPKKALADLSISLLLDDSEDNILAYLHRGILYNDIGKFDDAIPDFEAVLKLNKDMAVAHVSLGLIYMLKMENHHRAIKKFTAAMRADPTYVKAYVCRAEAHVRIHDIKNALLDITRAIHLSPDVHHYYMFRGELVRKLGDLELAAFCVKHAAELDEGLGQSPTQKAIVQSFLKNYDKAIEALQSASRIKPVAPLFILLGKTQMKAQRWRDAVVSFEKALDLVTDERQKLINKKPWQRNQPWPVEAAEMNYLIGKCQVELRDFANAHDAFNNAIQVDKKHAEAYFWRGVTKVKLKQPRGVQDFNKALALDGKIFQAYLARAAYYGLKGQYTKAILNCNEAIKLQPSSVRSFLYRGALKYHIKAYGLAIRDLGHAIAIDNKCPLAYFNRAVCHQDSGNWQKALQDYGIVMLLGDDLKLKVLINRGLLYLERGDYVNALHDFLIAAQVYPKDKQIHHTLGLCYHKLGKLEEAVKSFTRSLELDPFFLDGLISRGNVFMDFGTTVGHRYARFDYERALHLNPTCLPARVNLAYTLQVAGKYQQAWHQFTKAISINPRFKPALEGRAIINLQMSDTWAAFQDISAAITVRATAELLTNRGVIQQFMGERHSAMRDYQAAAKLDPSYALAFFNAANMYFHTRQFKQALENYDRALTLSPKDESALLNRAITKVMLKDARGALTDFEKAIKISPYSAHIYFNRGNLYASMGTHAKAEADYTKTLELQPDDPLVHKRRADVLGKLGRRSEAIEDYRHAVNIEHAKYKRKVVSKQQAQTVAQTWETV